MKKEFEYNGVFTNDIIKDVRRNFDPNHNHNAFEWYTFKKRIMETMIELMKNIKENSFEQIETNNWNVWKWKIELFSLDNNKALIISENVVNEKQKEKLENIWEELIEADTTEKIQHIKLKKYREQLKTDNCNVGIIETFWRSYPIKKREEVWDNKENFNMSFNEIIDNANEEILYLFVLKTMVVNI